MKKSVPPPSDSPAARLREARIDAKFETARAAAEAMGVKEQTYNNHENGGAGLSRSGERYARFYRVSLDWLLTGRGEKRPSHFQAVRKIIVDGYVGASVAMAGDPGFEEPKEKTVDIPIDSEVHALVVKGHSQYPRFLDGEVILYDPRAVLPEALAGQYAVVQTLDGRRLIKIIERASADKWRLKSHNAPEETVELLCAWRYLGVMIKS
jgi:DNA-binding XRE family transcriptional regulator